MLNNLLSEEKDTVSEALATVKQSMADNQGAVMFGKLIFQVLDPLLSLYRLI